MQKNDKQTLGEFFQEMRKEKGVSIDEIVRECNISKKYIEAIESDNYTVFPCETYAMGFITSYADVLEIKRETVLSMYKKQMQIEQDSPIEQLVGKQKSNFSANGLLIFLGIAVLGVLIYFLATQIINTLDLSDISIKTSKHHFTIGELEKASATKYRVGDTIRISNENKVVVIELVNVGMGNTLNVKINTQVHTFKTGEQLSLDSDNNGTNDMNIELVELQGKTASLKLVALNEKMQAMEGGLSDSIYRRYKEYVLNETEFISMPTRKPLTMTLSAVGYGYISYFADDGEESESYLSKGASVAINFKDNLVLYLGNSAAIKLIVGGKEEVGGGWGEVNKSIFYWKYSNNKYVLMRAFLK